MKCRRHFFIYLAFVIWVILLKFSTSPDALPHLRNINLIPYGDCLMVNGNLNIRELAENILIFVPFGIYGGMLARERAGGTVILAGADSCNCGNCWYVGSECTDLYHECIEKENVICNNNRQYIYKCTFEF